MRLLLILHCTVGIHQSSLFSFLLGEMMLMLPSLTKVSIGFHRVLANNSVFFFFLLFLGGGVCVCG